MAGRRTPTLALASLSTLALLVAEPASARVLELPTELSLGPVPVRLELDDADVEVEVLGGEGGQTRLVARSAVAGRDGRPVAARVRVATESGTWIVRRAVEEGAPPGPRLRLRLVLGRDQPLTLVGRDLGVDARGPELPAAVDERRRTRAQEEEEKAAAAASAEPQTSGAGAGLYDLQVVASQVHAVGLRGLTVQADDSWLGLERTAGVVLVTVNGGNASIAGHAGAVDVLATDSEVTLADVQGPVKLDLLGGSFDASDGAGRIEAKAEETLVLITAQRGALAAETRGGGFEMRGAAAGLPGQVSLKSQGTRTVLGDLRGSFFLYVVGGSLEASALEGELQMEARDGSEVQLEDARGRQQVTLAGADASFAGMAGRLEVTAQDSRLRVDGVEVLALTASGGELTGTGITRVERLELDSVRAELDLTAVTVDPKLGLRGTSRLDLRLSTPCVVQVRGVPALLGQEVEVDGCDLRSPEQALRSARNPQRYGRRPLHATVHITSGVELSVSGL